ncbi:DHA2 family efflux MFS transporter permease subunit [Nocardia sp. NPDC049149]|uniref:DHA2 family efflux MFS transporter permease subunit n=1 Tax=Nocardia sp. NPDC049149 TaxID=3364315 RepID=UPI00371D3CD7
MTAITLDSDTRRVPLLAICLGYFLVILDVTVVAVAIPTIGDSLGAEVNALQWVVDGYTLTFAGLLLFAGGLGDRFGAKPVFVAGLAAFSVASAGCGLAVTPVVLIVARLAQGAAAALLVPASLSLLRAAYPDPAHRARAFGVWGMVAGLAAGLGPVLGGLLTGMFGWRAVFFVNLPVAALALLLTVRTVPSPHGTRGRGLDLPAQLTGFACVALLVGALNEAGRVGWTHPSVLVLGTVAVVALAVFLALEANSASPMLPLALFRRGELAAATVVGLLMNLGFYALLFAAPLYFQRTYHLDAWRTGLALLPMAGLVAVSSALAGRVMARTGPRRPMLIGLLVGAAGIAGWLLAGPNTPYLVLVAPMLAAGAGTAFTMPAATGAAMTAAPADRSGAASALLNTARQLGSAVGVALAGTMLSANFLPGLHITAVLGTLAFLVGALVTAIFIGTT